MSDTPFIVNRDIFDNGIWKNIIEFRLFILIFGKARFDKKPLDMNLFKISRGQWLRSYRKLQDDLEFYYNNAMRKYSLSQIKKAVDSLVNSERIQVEDTELGTLFTVVNYEYYQDLSRYKGGKLRTSLEQTQNRLRTGLEQGQNNKIKDYKDNKDYKDYITWRENFEIYKSEMETAYNELIADDEFIETQDRLHGNIIDIRLSLEKAKTNFWGTEAGWRHKKKSKSKEIDWKLTFVNAIDINKVYKPKDDQSRNVHKPKFLYK
jgi:hypothetical protein